MKFKNLTRLLFGVSMVGLVCFGPMLFGNKKSSAAATPFATDRYVAVGGSDTTDCSTMGMPCATIQYAVGQSSSGDTIHVAAGTYTQAPTPPLVIDKTLTLLGAQAGVDARSAPRPVALGESILSNTQGTSVSASNVVIDGFTVQDSSNQAFTGYGIWLNPGINGTQILNNIFQNNVAGLGLSNGGASQALIKHNLFQNNNLGTGSAFGSGIYTDEFVGGAVSNVKIDANKFSGNNNAGIGFSSHDTTNPDANITITNNVIDSCGRGIYFWNTQSSSVMDNTITNSTVPTDGGTSAGIAMFGAVSDLSILRNNIEMGAKRGIRIGSFMDASHPNFKVEIHLNNIVGNADAGLFVDDTLGFLPALDPTMTSTTFADCNWWGSITGPTNPVQNPTGTGDAAKGTVVTANFTFWLLGLAPDAPCGLPPAAGTITACKFYDKNANGVLDAGDLPLNNWPITINPLGSANPSQATQLTGASTPGCVSWANLDPASSPYTVSEGTPTQTNWVHSTAASVSVTVVSGQTSSVSFGNYCKVPSGGLTLGFWSNKNGQAILQAHDPAWRTLLNGCCLRNANGSIYQVPSGSFGNAYSNFRNWLLNATATNMAYMLSAQLAAMKLNIAFGGVVGGAFDLCHQTTINQLVIDANAALCADGLTTAGDPNRATQEALKNCLDALNNGGPVVPPTPCPYTFP